MQKHEEMIEQKKEERLQEWEVSEKRRQEKFYKFQEQQAMIATERVLKNHFQREQFLLKRKEEEQRRQNEIVERQVVNEEKQEKAKLKRVELDKLPAERNKAKEAKFAEVYH